MERSFQGQVVWITGGGSGIGQALAMRFGALGAQVAVSGRREDKLLEVVDLLEAQGACGLAVTCDVADEAQVEEAVAKIVATWGRLDVVVANAGFGVAGPFERLTADDWRRQFDVNVVGLTQTVRYALPQLRKRSGRIVLMGSVAGTLSIPNHAPYHASKYAVRAIGQSLAMELVGSGVSCTTVQPGYVESEIGQVDNQGRFRGEWSDKRPKRLMWSAERAAEVIVDAVLRREREFTFTVHGKVAAFVGKHAPQLIHYGFVGAKTARELLGNKGKKG